MKLKKLIKQLKKFDGDSDISFVLMVPVRNAWRLENYENPKGENYDLKLEMVTQLHNSDPMVEIIFQNRD